jgi:hypothetical protein
MMAPFSRETDTREIEMADDFEDQAIQGVLENGVCIELARWSCGKNDYDADGWLDKFGERVGSGTARLPDKSWVDLSRFCLLRSVTLTP